MINAAIALVVDVIAMAILLFATDLGVYAIVVAMIIYAVVMCLLNERAMKQYMQYKNPWRSAYLNPPVSYTHLLDSKRSCRPRQIPRNGVPFSVSSRITGTSPVSYTHLEVKEAAHKAWEEMAAVHKDIEKKGEETLQYLKAVSYTHLPWLCT